MPGFLFFAFRGAPKKAPFWLEPLAADADKRHAAQDVVRNGPLQVDVEVMQYRSMAAAILAAALAVAGGSGARADDAKNPDAFATRLFADNYAPGANPMRVSCAVTMRAHLARHPLQKVSAMHLLVTTEKVTDKTRR